MKSYTSLLLIILLITSCKETTQSSNQEVEATEVLSKNEPTKSKPESHSTFLCKINGKDWSYTKASGIVSRHKKTKKRTAIITFTKQLEKGNETVQLFYDGDTNQLEKASIHLKQPKKDGGSMTAMYQLLITGGKRHPESKISGTLDLSNQTAASGTAEVLNIKMLFEEEQLKDESMQMISLSPIDFSGIGYSDSEKLFGSNSN